ncbi:nuclease-related domain-containing protein [Paenibacillus physcomitrellae]|uniref:NERD domain-containing protein n=1 Tax=Paenibacillus physcomitrellae TaxID=1619311 RepID=A0ABQ1FRA8_9BACL|nr:nuclease-related domain-containing protein [Paenibacillus physcomitrellae]GGA26099.1 hypothetical protein GCM10010917_08680 [Paenibacillus physcomitrellae]
MLNKILALFRKPQPAKVSKKPPSAAASKSRRKVEAGRIGELGEHKINIQLDQLPKDCKSLSDLMVKNPKSRTGYSQIDHLVITPYALFVIETKNYNGEIKGGRSDKQWSVSNRFKMYNPLMQNYGHIKAVENLLADETNLRFVSLVSFTMRCRFSIDPELRKIHSDELIVYDTELSEFISRKLIRLKTEKPEPLFNPETIQKIYDELKQANITDPAIRQQHIDSIKTTKSSASSGHGQKTSS